jgi:hypothetical protein
MPVDHMVNRELGVVSSRAWGVLTDGDLLEQQRGLGQDPEFEPNLNQLFDFRDVTDVQVTANGIRVLAERDPFHEDARRAFIIHPGALVMFGLMRMFENLTTDYPDELRVQFDHIKTAREWLGLPDEVPEAR